jgi:hypothetical protein
MDITDKAELVPPEQRYEVLKQQINGLSEDFSSLLKSESSTQQFHQSAQRGISLETDLMSLVRSAGDRANILFPDRSLVFHKVTDVTRGSFDKLPYQDLSREEMDKYISLLASTKNTFSGGSRTGRWYQFNPLCSLFKNVSSEEELLQKVSKNPTLVLSPEQEDRIAEHENKVFKVHIAVPEERRIEVLKTIMATIEHDTVLKSALWEEKKKRGEQHPGVTAAESEQLGVRLNLVGWKMLDFTPMDSQSERVADFVFYVPEDEQAPETAAKTAKQLATVVEPLNLPGDGRIPRYNIPVRIEGKKVNGLFIAQGDGDFKDYLLSKYGREGLGKYFDPEKNFAVRGHLEIPEAIKQVI